jgi:hypothetical protein
MLEHCIYEAWRQVASKKVRGSVSRPSGYRTRLNARIDTELTKEDAAHRCSQLPELFYFEHRLPKDGHDMPLLPYQRMLHKSLQNHKHIWIKKSRRTGVTEFLLRYIAWTNSNIELKMRYQGRMYVLS